MNFKDPKVIGGAVVVVLLLGFLLSRGSSGTTTTTGGVDRQKEFQNALQLQAADNSAKSTFVQALLAYDKSAKDYALGANTLTASSNLERARIQNAYLLGSQQNASQTQVQLAGIGSAERIGMAQNQTALQTATMQNQTAQQNGVLNFFGNLIGGIIGLFA